LIDGLRHAGHLPVEKLEEPLKLGRHGGDRAIPAHGSVVVGIGVDITKFLL
jgi:hypothetical protein